MDQNYNNSQNDFLWALLANPANDAQLYNYNLQRLVNDFPQSGILQAMLAHSSDEKNLKQASVYFSPKSLYKLINAPSSFTGVPGERIIVQSSLISNGQHRAPEFVSQPPAEEIPVVEALLTSHNGSENYFNERSVSETEVHGNVEEHPSVISEIPEHQDRTHQFNEDIQELPVENIVTEEHLLESKAQEVVNHVHEELPVAEPAVTHHELVQADIEEKLPESGVINNVTETVETLTEQPVADEVVHAGKVEDKEPEKPIEEETYEEIEGIENITITPEVNHQESKPVDDKGIESNDIHKEEEKLIAGGIAASDFFMFDKAFGGHNPAEAAEDTPVPAENLKDTQKKGSFLSEDPEQQDVSKYHDEKMPYTFMWWLDKTRKEHSGIYQPYTKPETEITAVSKVKNPTDELQQQYYENIFHITSVEELDKSTAPYAQTVPKFEYKHKEQVIIERFIQEEPQIRPQSSDKLDNENKAKKSSEDRDELVTETLAAIYSDQMLYHKAIASYKKLMLKFPEKSRYFAGKIEQLEKKTN